jgi:hypothetical protein
MEKHIRKFIFTNDTGEIFLIYTIPMTVDENRQALDAMITFLELATGGKIGVYTEVI